MLSLICSICKRRICRKFSNTLYKLHCLRTISLNGHSLIRLSIASLSLTRYRHILATLALLKRKWNWRKWTRIRSFWLGELLKSEIARTLEEVHRSRTKGSCETVRWKEKPEQSGQRRGVFEGGTPKGKSDRGTAERRAKGRLSLNRSERLEMTRHGRKGRTEETVARGRNQFRIKLPTMDFPLRLRSSSFYVLRRLRGMTSSVARFLSYRAR